MIQTSDRFNTFGHIANLSGRPLQAVIDDAWRGALVRAQAAFKKTHNDLAAIALVAQLQRSSTIPGLPAADPPLILAENSPIPEVEAVADLSAGSYGLLAAQRSLSLQAMHSMTPASLELLAAGMADHVALGLVDMVGDALAGLSLGASQTATTLQSGLQKYAALPASATAGGFPPPAAVLACAEDVRADAAAGRWAETGLSIKFFRTFTARTAYVLPAAESATIVAPSTDEVAMSMRPASSAALATIISASALAAPVQVRSKFVVRVTLA